MASDNDFSPRLDQSSYTVTLDENQPPGISVLNFTVTDADESGPGSELASATILLEDAQFFTVSINRETSSGEIRSK